MKPKSRTSGNLQPFLRYWLITCGVVLTIAASLGIGGLFSEPLAITASLTCTVAILACAIVGMIWMSIDVAKENVLLGLGVLLMPPVGLVVAYQKPGPARRGAIVYLSLVAPTLLLGLMLLVFLPKYTSTGQRAAQTKTWVDLMRKLDDQVRPETPVVTVALRVAARPGSLNGLQPECEALLLQFKNYVPRSLKIDADARIMTYQYRGHENFKTLIAFYLSSQTGAFIPQAPIEPGER